MRTCQGIFQSGWGIGIPTSNDWEFLLPHILGRVWAVIVLNFSHADGSLVHLTISICNPPMTYYLCNSHLCTFLGKGSIQICSLGRPCPVSWVTHPPLRQSLSFQLSNCGGHFASAKTLLHWETNTSERSYFHWLYKCALTWVQILKPSGSSRICKVRSHSLSCCWSPERTEDWWIRPGQGWRVHFSQVLMNPELLWHLVVRSSTAMMTSLPLVWSPEEVKEVFLTPLDLDHEAWTSWVVPHCSSRSQYRGSAWEPLYHCYGNTQCFCCFWVRRGDLVSGVIKASLGDWYRTLWGSSYSGRFTGPLDYGKVPMGSEGTWTESVPVGSGNLLTGVSIGPGGRCARAWSRDLRDHPLPLWRLSIFPATVGPIRVC